MTIGTKYRPGCLLKDFDTSNTMDPSETDNIMTSHTAKRANSSSTILVLCVVVDDCAMASILASSVSVYA